MSLFAIIGLGVGGFILFCIGKSGAPVQPAEIAKTSPISTIKIAGETENQVTSTADPKQKNTSVAVEKKILPVSIARGSIYGGYSTAVMPQTRRFQSFS